MFKKECLVNILYFFLTSIKYTVDRAFWEESTVLVDIIEDTFRGIKSVLNLFLKFSLSVCVYITKCFYSKTTSCRTLKLHTHLFFK